MNEELTREDVHTAADRLVEELLAAAGLTRPPVDAIDLARRHFRITIREETRPAGSNRRRRGPADVLFLSVDAAEETRQWAAAQAIGARLKPDLLRRLGLDPAARIGLASESFAGLIAQRVLTPTAWFAGDARAAGWDVAELSRLYATAGYELTAWRLLDLPEPCIITVVENDRVRRRRGNAWRIDKTLHPTERECQRSVHDSDGPRVVSADGWTVQGWPAPSAEGKREILRSVIDGGWE
jgi:predicted transcriptional regulator